VDAVELLRDDQLHFDLGAVEFIDVAAGACLCKPGNDVGIWKSVTFSLQLNTI
jgi:hypothetical protein